jgi:hypothetical protein
MILRPSSRRRGFVCRIVGIYLASKAPFVPAATINSISDPASFVSPHVVVYDFEDGEINQFPATFEVSNIFGAASDWAGAITPSGTHGVVEHHVNDPLRAKFSAPVFEVGTYFGNDENFAGKFAVTLRAFDSVNVALGTVVVTSNGNDYADQFIGLRSNEPVWAVETSYARPPGGQLSIYVDDFRVGLVPEPLTATLNWLAICGLAALRKARS